MDWFWGWIALGLAAGAFYESAKLKKDNKMLRDRIEKLEKVVYK
ncbi:hypothetical protein [Neobacillus kokaensis]|uniref:Uncharacterized protein n=1 Tax=Neobacillus kokaensis TaxID=2759023 RepID=A0ABQ3NCK4_9BACI|nr:hypothetical protein [Neobacillus kokaensis]GHI01655.1 hypothetical protein AM1BK_51970 [Neobacillus kokaensis]